jgi:HemK-related putative methylase
MQKTDQNDASRTVLAQSQQEKFPYSIEVEGLHIEVYEGVFSPKHFHGWEVFTKHFPNVRGKDVLEIGTGTGITALVLAKRGARKVLATDINPRAVANTQKNIEKNDLSALVKVRESDIFSAISPDEKFDIIYWNMPFMWTEKDYKYASMLERGLFDPGHTLADRFLSEGKNHLNPEGILLVGTADFGDPRFGAFFRENHYSARLIAQEQSEEINPVEFQLFELKSI